MRLERSVNLSAKGWYLGPWNSLLAISVGYATAGIDEPHMHTAVTEIYLIAQGTAEMRIEQNTIALAAGDKLVLEPGEASETARAEKVVVTCARLGM